MRPAARGGCCSCPSPQLRLHLRETTRPGPCPLHCVPSLSPRTTQWCRSSGAPTSHGRRTWAMDVSKTSSMPTQTQSPPPPSRSLTRRSRTIWRGRPPAAAQVRPGGGCVCLLAGVLLPPGRRRRRLTRPLLAPPAGACACGDGASGTLVPHRVPLDFYDRPCGSPQYVPDSNGTQARCAELSATGRRAMSDCLVEAANINYTRCGLSIKPFQLTPGWLLARWNLFEPRPLLPAFTPPAPAKRLPHPGRKPTGLNPALQVLL